MESKGAIIYVILSVLILAFIGASFATIKTLYFEKSADGTTSIRQDCLQYDQKCVQDCSDMGAEYQTSVKCNCCMDWGDVSQPLGLRLTEQIKYYSIIGGGIGVGLGLILAENAEIRNRRKLT